MMSNIESNESNMSELYYCLDSSQIESNSLDGTESQQFYQKKHNSGQHLTLETFECEEDLQSIIVKKYNKRIQKSNKSMDAFQLYDNRQNHSKKFHLNESIKRSYKKRRAFLKITPVMQENIISQESGFCLYSYLYIEYDLNQCKLKLDSLDDLINKGFLSIHSLSITKLINSFEIIFNNNKEGIYRFQFLVEYFKKSQINELKDLSNILSEYYEYSINQFKYIDSTRKSLKQNRDILDLYDEQFTTFYQKGIEYINSNYKQEEVYTYTYYYTNYRTGQREVRVKGYSTSYIQLIYSKTLEQQLASFLLKQKNQKFSISTINAEVTSLQYQCSKIAKQISDILVKEQKDTFTTTLITADGVQLEAQQQTRFIKGDRFQLKQQQENDYLLEIQTYQINLQQLLQNIIEKNYKINMSDLIQNSTDMYNQELQNQIFGHLDLFQFNQDISKHEEFKETSFESSTLIESENLDCLDYICQAEFFLEKFYQQL